MQTKIDLKIIELKQQDPALYGEFSEEEIKALARHELQREAQRKYDKASRAAIKAAKEKLAAKLESNNDQ